MKFELKTENDYLNKSIFSLFFASVTISFVLLLLSISIKLGDISKYYEINYLCRILIVDKSSNNFKKISKLSNFSSKQKIWDLCMSIVK
tara:strand:+ start:492 stop:758 length:267 start_codon:yes stop_codon:yes gene_type:complete